MTSSAPSTPAIEPDGDETGGERGAHRLAQFSDGVRSMGSKMPQEAHTVPALGTARVSR
jgi:hypothetical protein